MSILINEFCDIINRDNEFGDVLEFGTGNGDSASIIAPSVGEKRKLYTFDGFQGLPETKKGIPIGTGWEKGAYCYDVNKVKDRLKYYNNVIVEKTMTWDLKTPNEYGIDKIVAANMDLDLYEGTLDALRFINKCNWNVLTLRFDDWGAYSYQIASEVDAHEKAAFFDWINETGYQYEIILTTGLQSVITVKK